MTLLAPVHEDVRGQRRRTRHSALALAPGEAWRLIRHPVALAGLAINLVMLGVMGADGDPLSFGSMTAGATFYGGVFTYFAANLVTTRERRSGAEELLAPLPEGPHTRTVALCLAAMGPFLLHLALAGLAFLMFTAGGTFFVDPPFWHVVQGPLTVLGGALLGVLVGRWAPFPGVALVVMVSMIAFNVTVANGSERYMTLGTHMEWTRWGPNNESNGFYGYYPGSPAWHDAYLLALCGMAAAGALLRTAAARLPVLVAGALLTAAMLATGWAQLP